LRPATIQYTVPPSQSTFDLQRIRDETFVREIDFHWTIASTNSHAMQRAEQDTVTTPLLVLAQQQTAGRGRGQNRWWSSAGSLTFSLLLPLDRFPAVRLPQISLTVGVAICEALQPLSPQADLALKWPNDVYLADKKLGGILIELPPRRPPHAVIGVGINVNNALTDADEQLAARSVALCEVLRCPADMTDVLINCLQQIEAQLATLLERPEHLIALWRSYHLLPGRWLEIDAYGRRLQGICRDIDDDGALLIETSDGVQRCVGGVITDFQRRATGRES
jgi:BirA family biotin operon repressor/biotin-[acetyl-CoA-carboxylase] ligase